MYRLMKLLLCRVFGNHRLQEFIGGIRHVTPSLLLYWGILRLVCCGFSEDVTEVRTAADRRRPR